MRLLVWALLLLVVRGLQIRCMNFYGLETERAGLVCDWQHPPEWYMERLVKDLDINTIRLPFSYQYVTQHDLTKMESFIMNAQSHDIRIILDYHRTWSSHQGPTPEEGINLQDFTNAWIFLLKRFEVFHNVIGVGVFNEIQSPDLKYTLKMHRTVITAIEKEFPNRFLFFAGCPNWGGNCAGMQALMDLNRTYIEVHKYHFSGASNRDDWDKSMPTQIPSNRWFIGETGWKHTIPFQRLWAEGFLAYLKERQIDNVCAWTIAHSGDTAGWFHDDCETFDRDKAELLKTVWQTDFLNMTNGDY